MAEQALESFEALSLGIPGWIAEIEGIVRICADVKEQTLQLQNRKSQTAGAEQTLISLMARRRKTSIDSSDSSWSRKRTHPKPLVVVAYDGDVQRRIEELVRSMNSCRNHLRKGKLSAKIESLARHGSGTGDDDVDISFAMRTRRTGRIACRDDIQVFDDVDASIGKCQVLCEDAAHQVLRAGDCTAVLSTAKAHLVETQRKASLALPGLQVKAQEAAGRQLAERVADDAEDSPGLEVEVSPRLGSRSSQHDIEVELPQEAPTNYPLSGFDVRTYRSCVANDLKQAC